VLIGRSVPANTSEPFVSAGPGTSGIRASVAGRPESVRRFGSRTPRNCSTVPGTVDRVADSRMSAVNTGRSGAAGIVSAATTAPAVERILEFSGMLTQGVPNNRGAASRTTDARGQEQSAPDREDHTNG
jgi:hypothetical protein